MLSKNNEIISKILTMDEERLAKFLSSLKPGTLGYLEILLNKAEGNIPQLKRYLSKQ